MYKQTSRVNFELSNLKLNWNQTKLKVSITDTDFTRSFYHYRLLHEKIFLEPSPQKHKKLQLIVLMSANHFMKFA